jgi:hypothetical protein
VEEEREIRKRMGQQEREWCGREGKKLALGRRERETEKDRDRWGNERGKGRKGKGEEVIGREDEILWKRQR